MTPSGYALAGSGDPVVLIHGSMNSKSQWKALSHKLEKHYTVLAIDLTGYGRTPFPEDPDNHALETEAALIRRTIADVLGGPTPVHLVTHSYGGAVALCYASRFPSEVRSLALFEPMANHLLVDFDHTACLDEGRSLIGKIGDFAARGEAEKGAEIFVDYFSGKGIFSILPDKARETLATYIHKMLLDYKTTIYTSLTIEDYRRIACPFCVVTGDASTEVSLCVSKILREQIETIEWVEIPGNHMAPIATPEAFNGVVEAWLDRVTRSQTRLSA